MSLAVLVRSTIMRGARVPRFIAGIEDDILRAMVFRGALDGDLTYQAANGYGGSLAGVGGLTYPSGPWSGSRSAACELATTNLCQNPSVETNLTGWSDGGFGTLARVAGGYSGPWAARYTTTGANLVVNIPNGVVNPTKNATYTFSVWVKGIGSTIGKSDRVTIMEQPGGAWSAQNFTWPSAWTRVTVTRTIASDGQTGLAVQIYNATAPYVAGEQVLVDAAQLELQSYVSTYCDGSLGAGFAWTGAAHASTSTRAAASLGADAPWLDPSTGSVFCWVYGISAFANLSRVIEIANAVGDRRLAIRRESSGTRFDAYDGSTWLLGASAAHIGTGSWKSLYFDWEPGQQRLSVNNAAAVVAALPDVGIVNPRLFLGAASDNTLQGNVALAQVLAFSQPLTPDQRTYLHQLDRAPNWQEV